MIALSIYNPGPLPLRLEGIVEETTAEAPNMPRWTALWVGHFVDMSPNAVEQLVPFAPLTIQPGSELQVSLVGRAGLCAYGPDYTLDTVVQGWATRESDLTFAYSVLGLQATSKVLFTASLVEPYREHCS
jgi:hypothetical protein